MNVSTFLKRLGSDSTRENYSIYLQRFFDFCKVKPSSTLKWDLEKVEDKMEDFKTHLINEDMSGQTIHIAWAAVKRWFRVHKIKITTKCENVSKIKTYLDYIPSKDEFRRVLEHCKLPYKVALCFIGFSGMRPSDVRRLQYKHIKASYEAGDEVLTITLKQQKTGEWYFTFLGPQGVRYVKELLEERQKHGEVVTDESFILTGGNNEPVSKNAFQKYFRTIIRKTVGKNPSNESFRNFRTYGFRKYFRRWAGKLGNDTAEFLMGHVSGIRSLSATYSGLRDLDSQAIEEIKQKYVEYLPELETEISDLTMLSELEMLRSRVEELEGTNEKLLKTQGHFLGLEDEEEQSHLVAIVQDLLDKQWKRWDRESEESRIKLREAVDRGEIKPDHEQKVIREEELEAHLAEGWLFKAALNNGSRKMIVERLNK